MESEVLRPTIGQVLGQLRDEGHEPIDDERARLALTAQRAHEAPLPWYVRVLMGVGAWVSMVFVLVFLGMIGVLSTGLTATVMGLVCAVAGLWLRRRRGGDFQVQLSLSLSLAGRAMLYVGLGTSGEGGSWLAAFTALAVELAMVAVFPDVVNRFVSTLGAYAAVLVLLGLADAPAPLFHLLTGVLGALAAAAWLKQPRLLSAGLVEHHAPVAYGLSVALLSNVLTSSWSARQGVPWVTGVALLLVAIVTCGVILRELRLDQARTRALVMAVVAGVGLLTLGSPGVMAALLLLALGVHRRAPLLGALASTGLVLFGIKFYYGLELTLLAKSGLLCGSGLLLLGARALLERRRNA